MERNTAKFIRYDALGPKVCENLKSHHFDAYYVKTAKEAEVLALSLIPAGETVAYGGSQTLDALGLIPKLKKTNEVMDRESAKTPDERTDIMRRSLLADNYIMGSNAISTDGTLVNIDGNGNRVAALVYGPKSVIILAGMNKVCADVPSAHVRAHTVAAPTNAARFDIKTPCKLDGVCHSCHSPQCICNQILETRNSRPAGRIKVILIGEDLGM